VNAKVNGINISIDSLDKEKFEFITGMDKLEDILIGLNELQDLNFKNIKVNAVLLKGVNDSEQDFDSWMQFVKSNQIDFRYIELMQTGDNLDYFKKYHVSANIFRDYLLKKEWIHQTEGFDAGPSKNYIHKDFKGRFGIIAPYSKDFCKSCNRLRITAQGDLRLCLFGDTGISLRALLQNDQQIPQLKDLINAQLNFKKESHYLELGNTGITPHLASIGG
jgi:cyclic pyranopterin phosphate synthase